MLTPALLPPEATVTIQSSRLPDSADCLQPDLDRVVKRLTEEFPDADEQQVRRVVAVMAAGYREVRIRQFVPVFVERESREWMRGCGFGAGSVARSPQYGTP